MWEVIEVNSVGRPELVASEQDLLVERKVGIYEGKYKAIGYQSGRAYLTTHRICYVDDESPQKKSLGLKLSTVKDIEYYGGFLKSSPKITIYLNKSESADSSRSATPSVATTIQVTWVCAICFYSNALPKTYEHGVSELPTCQMCGIKATTELIQQSISSASTSPEVLDNRHQQVAVQESTHDSGFPCPRCTFINHISLNQCEICGARLLSSRLPPALVVEDRSSSPGPSMLLIPGKDSNGNVSSYMIKLSFRGTGDKAFYDQLKVALQAKAWEKPYNGLHRVTSAMDNISIAQNSSNGRFGPGIHGLEQMGERHRQKNQEVLGDALADLEALMQRAKDVVKLAESYARHLEREELSNSNGTSAVALEARKALRQSSEALGLSSSIITKEMAPGQEIFHEELARQVADFLDRGRLLAKEGGVMTLVDLFAIYNRARGISLISPNDLYSACKLLESLRLPIIMRQFKSGLLVVQESYRTPKVIIRNILAWISKLDPWQLDIGVSAQDACAKFGWSLTVAIEELEMAEQYGALCRDEQVSGTRFFENRFVPYAV